MELGSIEPIGSMEQHPRLTLDWALRCLERALSDLDDGPAERRVRRQFHQLLLAIEREAGEGLSRDFHSLPTGGFEPGIVEPHWNQ
jgi:hypothetical protein